MNKELTDFLTRHDANSGIVARLNALGAETLADAWDKASPKDLVWGVTRPGVMSAEQRRLFLVFVLESIEDKLTDPRSKNILEKLRTNSPITEDDADAAADADAAEVRAATWAAAQAAQAAMWAAQTAMWAAEDTADSAMWAAEAAAWEWAPAWESYAWATKAYAAEEAARAAQARWIRDNFTISDLNIN